MPGSHPYLTYATARLACMLCFMAPGLAYGLVTSRMPALKTLTGATEGEIGLILLVFGLAGLVGLSCAPKLVERLTAKTTLVAAAVGCMLFVALVLNPLIVWFCTRRNPYPLTWMTLRESGVTAFFTRSSAANIPVNLNLCRKLGLPESTFGVSIPLGATINMAGAAITITVLALAACHSLNIQVDVFTAILLSAVAALCACGAAGVPGGSLMLIPLACSLFGIDNGTAMQVVAVGFIIGVLQDSAETGLNSSSDVLFTAAACLRAKRLQEEAAKKPL